MNIFDIVSGGEVIIASDEDLGVIVTWNSSLTLSTYSAETFSALDCRTLEETPQSMREAFVAAEEWLDDLRSEGSDR